VLDGNSESKVLKPSTFLELVGDYATTHSEEGLQNLQKHLAARIREQAETKNERKAITSDATDSLVSAAEKLKLEDNSAEDPTPLEYLETYTTLWKESQSDLYHDYCALYQNCTVFLDQLAVKYEATSKNKRYHLKGNHWQCARELMKRAATDVAFRGKICPAITRLLEGHVKKHQNLALEATQKLSGVSWEVDLSGVWGET
jgi:hypothetical protein